MLDCSFYLFMVLGLHTVMCYQLFLSNTKNAQNCMVLIIPTKYK